MTTRISFPSRGQAHIINTDGVDVVLLADFAAPPGCPLEGTAREGAESIRIKVRGCRRVDETHFEIAGRFVSLSKTTREWLLSSTREDLA
jgi:hypothetical protein